jgi:positive regulator of sigma E activity
MPFDKSKENDGSEELLNEILESNLEFKELKKHKIKPIKTYLRSAVYSKESINESTKFVVGMVTGMAITTFLLVYLLFYIIGKLTSHFLLIGGPISYLIIVFIITVIIAFIYLNIYKRRVKDALNSNYDYVILFISKKGIEHELGHILHHKESIDIPFDNKGFLDGILFWFSNIILDKEV